MANNVSLSYPSSFYHQFFDENGKPLSSGKLYTYIAGSTTPVVTYKTISGGTESANRNTNPIILDMAGIAELVISTDTAYKFVLFDKNNVRKHVWDNVTAGGSEGGGSSEEIVVEGTQNEIDVSASVTQGVKRYVVSLSNSIKSAILFLTGLYNNVVNSLENKADKVQGATSGNLAALNADGNLTDSGSKVSDFKTKQTAVPDPSASGTGLAFIDSISQNTNGDITPHKKSVQDGTTAQKGVVKLNNAIDSSSTTEAATPKAVKDAYDALNNKIVARATFLSQAEWAVQSQLQGDPAKVYYVENGTGEDAYTVYVWNTATNTYVEVDESSISLDGYWHDAPTTTGDGNVVTSVTLGNNGVPQIVKGITALTQHQDISGKLDKNGDASNTTATFTIASSRTNISSGEKLSVIFGKIAKWFADLKAVAFSGSYTDLSDKPTIPAAANNGVLTIKQNGTSVGTFSANQSSNTEINVTDTTYESKSEASGGTAVSLVTTGEKYTWNHKQNAIGDLAEIRSGAAAGATALQPSGNGSNVTATFTVAGSRTNISTGEKLSVIFGKIAKWLGDLKALAFRDSVGTEQIDDDSVTAAKVKDNETLPVHISGTAESAKRFNNEVGTSGADGHRAIFGGIDSENNVKIAMSERTGGVSKSTEITPSGITTTGGMIIGGDIIIGGSNPATDVKDNSNLAVLIASKANKASSGNGNLAVIDTNGNYSSSGIGAYAQSQLNSSITNSVIPWLTDNSYIVTHSFWIQINASVVGRAINFVNSYTGENLLRISVSYDYANGEISFILPWSNASWNGWIIANPDPQSTAEVGGAIITANGTKHTSNSSSDTVTPFFTHTEETIHSNNVSQTTIGTFNVGKSTMYDTSSYYDFVITLFNGLSSKRVTLKISMAIDRYVSGSGTTANIIGMATIDASGLNT